MTLRWSKLTWLVTAAVVAAVVVFLSGPPAPRPVTPVPAKTDHTLRGAFHIHTTQSDGALAKTEIAAAAARAGLEFAVFTDHGTGLRPPDPPSYIHGVLCVDGVEISTNQGHYIGVGMSASPYPLGGDAEAVAEDVARLGGFGVAAHPVSARPELAWSDWDVPIDGLEWLNADSEWRDESRLRLARGLLDYAWRPAGALATLLDRPVEALRRWDELASNRQVVALAGHDAHGGLGAENGMQGGRRLHVPSYEASFRTFSIYTMLPRPLTRDATADAEALVEALRSGAVFTAVDAIATPAALDFRASLGEVSVTTGQALPPVPGSARFSVRASVPSSATTMLKRDGRTVAEASGGVLDHEASLPGAYRVEIAVSSAPGTPAVPWLVSNPIYWRQPGRSTVPEGPVAPPVSILSLMDSEWRVESDAGSSGTVGANGNSVTLTYRLRDQTKVSQFVALAVDLRQVPADANVIVFRGRAAAPMRVSAQLRFARYQEERWATSIYLDPSEREIRIPVGKLRYAGGPAPSARQPRGQLPPADHATSLLFAVDLTNAAPGAQGTITLRDVALGRN